ncbi:hypothetical protein WJX73_000014 [Symbiochloris irregularis]|uniref:ABC transporter domain-containing protein n=1 Tax=Symbiochloris irregularis TaxID=706552 RepID=A0AAW1PF12_9CHLO
MAAVSDFGIPVQVTGRALKAPIASTESFSRARQVEPELQAAVIAEALNKETAKHGKHAKEEPSHKSKALNPAEVQRLATQVLNVGKGEDGERDFVEKLGALLRDSGVKLPSVTIEYSGLEVEVDALLNKASIPTLYNAVLNTVKGCVGLGKLSTKRTNVLSNVTGRLVPGRITLLLGPPGAGKSVFLKALGGQLPTSKYVRRKGSVKYNGHTQEEFVVQRTIALVDQIDAHIPSLTVTETLAFARQCQVGPGAGARGGQVDIVAELRRARARKGSDLNSKIAELQRQHSDNKAQAQAQAQGSATVTKDAVRAALNAEQQKDQKLPGEATEDEEFERLVSDVWGTTVKTEVLMRILGLANCRDTVLGGAMVRGVSGGERKRVTSAEHLVGPKRVLLMDEISTGLDSATTYTVIDFLARSTHMLNLTTMISLLQPPPEVFYLFDDVLLLTDGRVCYHGPVKESLAFFSGLGLVCPVRKDPASFLQEVTTPKGQLAFANNELCQAKGVQASAARQGDAASQFDDHDTTADSLLVDVGEIESAYRNDTPWGRQAVEELAHQPFKREEGHPGALVRERYALSWPRAVKVVTERQWTLTLRNKGMIYARIIQVLVISLVIGSLYSSQSHNSNTARNFFGVGFLSIMFLSMGAMPELAIMLELKGVFYKHRDNNFFQPSAWMLALVICRLPFVFVEAAVFSCVVYFWIGFSYGAGYFFLYYIILASTMLSMAAIFRFNAATSPDLTVANAAGGLVILMLVITSGFAIVRQSIRGYYIWIYYLSPFAYALRALVVNELTSPNWRQPFDPQDPTGPTVGQHSLTSFGFFTDRKWIWIGIVYNLGLCALLTGLAAVSLCYIGPPKARPSTTDDKKLNVPIVTKLTKQLSKMLSRMEEAHPQGQASSSLPFEPLTLVFKDLQYFVPAPKGSLPPSAAATGGGNTQFTEGSKQAAGDSGRPQLELLKSLTGYAAPGVLTALMGGSGAGKTTLLDVIAGRKTIGTIKGDILVNGHPKDQASWSRVVGYVEQTDIHSPQSTVREALVFSARLRLPQTVQKAQLNAFVDEVMDMMELRTLANSIIGIPSVSGLSVEQRKRLTIAVEVVANPPVIFMDEPTSGLDARAAAVVIRSVKKTSQSGRTVIVTIHQPSVEIFEAFDALVLLQRGGKLIYFGMLGFESSHLIRYLESIPGVPTIKPGENPATWQLEVTGGAAISGSSKAPTGVDFAAFYAESELSKQNAAMVERLALEGAKEHKPLAMSSQYAASFTTQVSALMSKWLTSYWRSPNYNLVRLSMTLVIALFYGTMYWHKGKMPSQGATIANVQNVLGVQYSSVQFQGMFNLLMVLPVVGYERTVLYRERAASMYSNLPYALALGVAEVPYLITQMLLFVPVSYFMIGFQRDAATFFFYCLIFLSTIAMFTWMGQMLVFLTPNQAAAAILGSTISVFMNIMNGFTLPYPSIPRGWKWLNRANPITWVLYALSASQLGRDSQPLTSPSGQLTTVKDFLYSYFGYRYDFIWQAWLIVVAYMIFFCMGAALAVKYVSFQRR